MYCILVAGVPASGKSTMAAYLAERLGVPVISKDGIKETLYDTIGFGSRAEKVRLGEAAMEIMYGFAAQCLTHGLPVILENNFEYASRGGLQALLDRCACPVLTVMMTGDWEAVYARFARRNQSPQRHRGHVVNDRYPEEPGRVGVAPTMPMEAFVHGFRARGMDRPPVRGACIHVDATDLSRVDREEVLELVRFWIERVSA